MQLDAGWQVAVPVANGQLFDGSVFSNAGFTSHIWMHCILNACVAKVAQGKAQGMGRHTPEMWGAHGGQASHDPPTSHA